MKRSTTAVCPASNSSTTRSRGRPGHTNLGLLDALPAGDLVTKVVIMAVFAYDAGMSDERTPRKTIR